MKKLNSLSLAATLTVVLTVFSSTASAQSADAVYIAQSVNNAASGIVGAINNFAAYVMTTMKADIQGAQPNLTQTLELNPYTYQLGATEVQGVSALSITPINDSMGPVVNPGMTAALASNIAGDVLPPTNVKNPGTLQSCGNAMFNFESLMGYLSYANQTMACNPGAAQDVSPYALNYVKFSADLGAAPSMFSINQLVSNNTLTLTQAGDLQKSPEWTEFELHRRHLVSTQSAGVSNLYYLYNRRVPDGNGNSAELLADQVANWRTNSKSWYTDMSTALSTVLLRENVFIMAEIERDLHEMRKENQRILAMQALMLIRGTELGKTMLSLKEKAVQDKMNSIIAPTSSSQTSSSISQTINSQSATSGQNAVSQAVSQSGSSFGTGTTSGSTSGSTGGAAP
jgi:hypothetical protein